MKLKLIVLALVPLLFVGCLNDLFDDEGADITFDGDPQVEFKPLFQEVTEIVGTASIDIQLIGAQRSNPVTVTVSADESSSAVEGVHYNFISNQATIEPNSSSVTLDIEILDSGAGNTNLVVNIDEATDGVIPSPNLMQATIAISEFGRDVAFQSQALDLRADDFNLVVSNITGQAGDAVVITTSPAGDSFVGETIAGFTILDSHLRDGSVVVNVEGASPVDHVAHVIRGSQVSQATLDNGTVSEDTFGNVAASSGVAAIYAVAQFEWSDVNVTDSTNTVSVDVIEVLYSGSSGADLISIDLHAVDEEGAIGAFVGISQEDLTFNTVHNNVVIDVLEAVAPGDDAPVREEAFITETATFFAMAHLGPAGLDADGGRIPAQKPALRAFIVSEDGAGFVAVGDEATVTVE